MRHHPLTYTYFFNQDTSCNDVDCHELAIVNFFKDVSDLYINSEFNKGYGKEGYPIKDVEVETASFLQDRTSLSYNYDVSHGTVMVMAVAQLEALNDELGIWGNEKPRKRPDHVGFYHLNYVDLSNMLIEASKKNPTILIYRGIDRQRTKNKKSCYGGFFIQNGKPIVVDELRCVKFVD
jgi:hypothetical protein